MLKANMSWKKDGFYALSWSKHKFDAVSSTYQNIPSMQRNTTNHKVSWYEKGNKQKPLKYIERYSHTHIEAGVLLWI